MGGMVLGKVMVTAGGGHPERAGVAWELRHPAKKGRHVGPDPCSSSPDVIVKFSIGGIGSVGSLETIWEQFNVLQVNDLEDAARFSGEFPN